MRKLGIFRNVVCNVVIGIVVIGVLAVSLSAGAVTASGRLKPVYKGTSDKNVSLMFNVYTGGEFIDSILDILSRNGIRTTFFVGGSWAAANEEKLIRIYEVGHEIGNHGYYNKDLKTVDEQRTREEIEIAHKLIKSILGADMTLFAPPVGSFNETTLRVASALGYKTVMWTNDTQDLKDKDKKLIHSRAIKNISGGTLVLMHPTKATVEALPDILKSIADKGLRVTTVSEALGNESV